jgi:hypothetical protein
MSGRIRRRPQICPAHQDHYAVSHPGVSHEAFVSATVFASAGCREDATALYSTLDAMSGRQRASRVINAHSAADLLDAITCVYRKLDSA